MRVRNSWTMLSNNLEGGHNFKAGHIHAFGHFKHNIGKLLFIIEINELEWISKFKIDFYVYIVYRLQFLRE